MVQVAYGTSKNIQPTRLGSFVISNCEEMDIAGLYQATRFELGRAVTVPWAKEWFCKNDKRKGPIVGHLGPMAIIRLGKMIERMLAAKNSAQRVD